MYLLNEFSEYIELSVSIGRLYRVHLLSRSNEYIYSEYVGLSPSIGYVYNIIIPSVSTEHIH